MKKFLLLSFMLTFTFASSNLWAQERTISGKVTSIEDGSALPGVNVVLKGTASGTVTDIDGNYTLAVPSSGGTLVFSFIGLSSEEVDIGSRSVVDLQMSPDVQQLSEVVITATGERSRETYSGSITTVSSDLIENRPLPTIDQALQGNVAGLQLNASSGTPGSVQDIRIRGISSINASNEPLFVIDGVPVVSGVNQDDDTEPATGTLGVLSSLNANDIESMSVLKDAAATALYGARGSNGVIIITTKKGKSGKAQFTFNAQYGFLDRAVEAPDMLNAEQYDELWYESLVNAGFEATIEDARANPALTNGWDGTTDTDWFETTTNDEAKSQQYDFSVRGGNETTNYYVSIGYFQQDGVNLGADFERITGKVNLTSTLTDKLTISNSFTGSSLTQNGQLENGAFFGSPDAAGIFALPIISPYNDDGSFNLNINTGFFNPLYIVENTINEKIQTRAINNTQLTYEIIPGLQFISTIGLDYIVTEELYYDDPIHGDAQDVNGQSFLYNNRNFNYVFKNQLSYDFNINEAHSFNVSAVYEAQGNKYKFVGSGGDQFAAEGLFYPSSAGNPTTASGFIEDWYINSITGLVTYGFNNQFFVDASIRREGNSRFSEDNRWGTFYAIGGSWVFSQSNLLNDLSWLNLGKLRGSFGVTGNAGIGLNQYQSTLSYSGDYDGNAAVFPQQVGNQNLTWEKAEQWNVGVDFTIFDRISGTVEYFNKRNYELLLDVPLSRTTGFNAQDQNTGEMVNKGLEVTLNSTIVNTGDFTFDLGVNFTVIDNEVTELPVDGEGQEIGITTATRRITAGEPVYAWFMPTWAGVNPDNGAAQWLAGEEGNELTENYAEAGDRFQGGNTLATFFGGLNTNLSYKGVYLSANFYYNAGNKVYDSWAFYTQADGAWHGVANSYARLMDRWQQPGDISENPRNVFGNQSQSNAASSRRLYDGDFIRLRNLTLGYNLPSSLLSEIGFSSATFYVTGSNLWTWVKDDKLEYDPEVRADGFLDLTAPPQRIMSVGIKANF